MSDTEQSRGWTREYGNPNYGKPPKYDVEQVECQWCGGTIAHADWLDATDMWCPACGVYPLAEPGPENKR